MKKLKTSLSLVVLLILVLPIFNFSIDAEISEINELNKNIKYSNLDNVTFFEDFNNYTTDLRITNRFTDFTIYKGVAQLILHTAYRFTYFNSNVANKPQYKFNNMTVKARVQDGYNNMENKKVPKGSLGWGLCNFKTSSYDYEFVWFIFQRGTIFYPWNGLWVWSRSNGEFSAKEIKGINVREWHIYEIKWSNTSYDFLIDGEQVAQLTKGVSQEELGIEIWNDNAVWYPHRGNWGRIPILSMPIIPLCHRVSRLKRVDLDYIEITE